MRYTSAAIIEGRLHTSRAWHAPNLPVEQPGGFRYRRKGCLCFLFCFSARAPRKERKLNWTPAIFIRRVSYFHAIMSKYCIKFHSWLKHWCIIRDCYIPHLVMVGCVHPTSIYACQNMRNLVFSFVVFTFLVIICCCAIGNRLFCRFC